MESLWLALLFFLPAGVANASPVFANKIPCLNRWKTPLDFGKSVNGKRVLGNNKTWRGLVFGTAIGAMAGWLAHAIDPDLLQRFPLFGFVPALDAVLLGAWLGLGALVGDAVESFFKRQRGIASGESWFPFDQLDYILGGLVFSLPVTVLRPVEYLLIVAVWFGMHLIASYIGFLLSLKERPI